MKRRSVKMSMKNSFVRTAALAASALSVAVLPVAAAPPTNFTYQGQLKSRGHPVNAEVDLLFTLWDAVEGGTDVGRRRLEFARLRVADGLFSVELDFGAEVFTGEPRWLEIAVRFSEGRGDPVPLRPRQPITAAPVALFAITGNQGPAGPPGSAELVLPFSGTNTTNDIALAIGQTGLAAAAVFSIDNTANTQPALAVLTNGTGPGILAMTAFGPAIRGQTGPGGGNAGYFLTQGVVNTQAALLAVNQAMGPAAHLKATKRENTNPALLTETYGSGSAAHFKTHPDLNNVNLAPTILSENDQYGAAGQFKIINDQTSATALKVETVGSGLSFEAKTTGPGSGGKFEIDNTASTGHALEAVTSGTGHAASFLVSNTTTTNATLKAESRGNNSAIHAEAVGQGIGLFARASLGANAIEAVANGFGQAGVFLSTDLQNTSAAVEITSAGTNAALRVRNTNPLSFEAAYFVGRVDVARNENVLANSIRIQPTSGGAQLRLYDSTGASTIRLDAEYGGGGGRITTDEIMITGGSDLSEQFDVTGTDGDVEPGTVVCIDKNNPGKLIACRKSYDKTVAGIVSGAGGVRSGMLMGQAGSVANGAHPVALTGRVYCKADASNGPIEPGDLLTTSDTRGVAIVVTDHARAGGAIIGKAMTGLTEGQGLVLVLVALQ